MDITLEQFNQQFEKLEQRLDHLEKIVAGGQITTTRWVVGLFISNALIVIGVATACTTAFMLAAR